MFNRHHSQPPSHSSPPVSAHWVCLAGAGSGMPLPDSRPPSQTSPARAGRHARSLIGLWRDRRVAVFSFLRRVVDLVCNDSSKRFDAVAGQCESLGTVEIVIPQHAVLRLEGRISAARSDPRVAVFLLPNTGEVQALRPAGITACCVWPAPSPISKAAAGSNGCASRGALLSPDRTGR